MFVANRLDGRCVSLSLGHFTPQIIRRCNTKNAHYAVTATMDTVISKLNETAASANSNLNNSSSFFIRDILNESE